METNNPIAPQAEIPIPPGTQIDGQKWLSLSPAQRDSLFPPGTDMRRMMDAQAAAFQNGTIQQAIAEGRVQQQQPVVMSPPPSPAAGTVVPAPAPTQTLSQAQASGITAAESEGFWEELFKFRFEPRDIATAVKVVAIILVVAGICYLIYCAVR